MKEWQVKTGTGKLPCILRNGCFVAGMGEHGLALKDANDLVTAANQHAALLAVAEVLKRVETIPHFAHESVEATRGTKVFAGRNKLADDMRQALATLAQIQKGE